MHRKQGREYSVFYFPFRSSSLHISRKQYPISNNCYVLFPLCKKDENKSHDNSNSDVKITHLSHEVWLHKKTS